MLTAASVMNSGARVGRRVDREHVADAPRGAQAGIRRHDGVHQFVRMQRALHQRFDLARSRHRHRLGGGGVAVLGRNDLDSRRCRCCAPSAARRIFASGPTSTGSINSSRAASIAPMSEASSTGCTTAVFSGFRSRVALDELLVAAALLAHLLDEFLARLRGDRLLRRDDLRRRRPSRDRRADWSRALRSSPAAPRAPWTSPWRRSSSRRPAAPAVVVSMVWRTSFEPAPGSRPAMSALISALAQPLWAASTLKARVAATVGSTRPAPIVAACVASSEKSSGRQRMDEALFLADLERVERAVFDRRHGTLSLRLRSTAAGRGGPTGVRPLRLFGAPSSPEPSSLDLTRIKSVAARGRSIVRSCGEIASKGKRRYNVRRERSAEVRDEPPTSRGAGVSEPADSQEAVFRFLADPRTHGLSGPVGRVDTAERGRVSRRPRRLQGQAGGQVSIHGFLDARQAARGLRGGDRGQSRQCAGRLSRGAADRAQGRLAGDRGRGRNRRMGRAHAPIRRECDARPGRRARRRFGRDHRQARAGDPPLPRPRAACATRRGRRTRSRPISSRTTPLSPNGPICFRAATARRLTQEFASRLRDRAAGRCWRAASAGFTFAAVTAICICATSSSSTASRPCSTRSSFPTRSRAATCSTIWRFC